jgi:GT2 family glycosyltransferase|tara:strand:+ start:4813 stop:5463 length:651 start_codon:yes stop_codon:yes gene_type:complete
LQKHEIVILIPCFNEEKTIIKICKKAKKFGKVFIIDDKSTDNTKILLKKEKIYFLSNKENLGYENSLIKGFRHIFKNFKKTKYILTMDADGELPVKNIPKIINMIKRKKYDLIVGKRSNFNRFSENLLDKIFRSKFGLKDPISGFKLYKLKSLKKIINRISYNMFLVDILINFHKLNLSMVNVGIITKKRLDNPRVGNSSTSNLKILKIAYKILGK